MPALYEGFTAGLVYLRSFICCFEKQRFSQNSVLFDFCFSTLSCTLNFNACESVDLSLCIVVIMSSYNEYVMEAIIIFQRELLKRFRVNVHFSYVFGNSCKLNVIQQQLPVIFMEENLPIHQHNP